MPCIEFREVSKSVYGRKELDSISFSIQQGEVVAVFGNPKSSVSQLMAIASGFSKPDSGAADVLKMLPGDYDGGGMKYSIFGVDTFPPYLTPLNFVTLCARYFGFDMVSGRQAIRDAGIWDSRNLKYDRLSDVEKHLMCLAPLLCATPKIVLMESSLILDNQSSKILFNKAFGRLSQKKTTFVMSAASFAQVEDFATRVILLRNGKIVSDLPVRDIKSTSGRRETRIRVSDVAAASLAIPEAKVEKDCLVIGSGYILLAPIIAKLEASGISVLSVERGNTLFGYVPGVFER